MVNTTYTTEAQDILKIARERAISFGQITLTSEFLLDAIIRHEKNTALPLLQTAKTDLAKIKGQLAIRLESIKRADNSDVVIPTTSMQLRQIMDFAATISSAANLSIDGATLLHALYRAKDSFASQILVKAGYHDPGEKARPSSEGLFRRSSTPVLNSFSVDLTEQAMFGKLDPVIGRDTEISHVIEVLARRKKNNPVIIGEPGVGKTSIVEGLAIRIINDAVPEQLKNKRLVSLNLNSVVAGTQYRGQFERRMQIILSELEKNNDVIVFIDELHSLMGNGGNEGTGDAAQILKPALASGALRCIGATTLAEYRRHIEHDGALERRFQKILVDQPTTAQTLELVRQTKTIYELFHGVTFTEAALQAIVQLSDRYISDKNFPDKAIDVLDVTAAVGNLTKITQITEIEVQKTISKITGVPIVNLGKNDRERLKTIEQDLQKVVIGQEEGIKVISQAIKRTRTGVRPNNRPSSFLFLGPTGVGKTETARQLAKYLFDKEDSLIRIDMSEFGERFTISALVGAPPGYVGYEDGGKLTEAVRRKPYSIVLFDEIEKAHPDVFNILLQVLDDGILTDAAGRKIDFRNTILIITSNIGASGFNKGSLGFAELTRDQEVKKNFSESLKSYFKPEFLNRLDAIVTYNSLTKDNIKSILQLYVNDMNSRFSIEFSDSAKEFFASNGYSIEYGARPLRRLLEKEVETKIADLLLDVPEVKSFEVDIKNNSVVVTIKNEDKKSL